MKIKNHFRHLASKLKTSQSGYQTQPHQSEVSSHRNPRFERSSWLTFGLILFELILIILVSWAFVSPLDQINHFQISGNQHVKKSLIQRDLKIKDGRSLVIWLAHFKRDRQSLTDQNPWIKSVHFRLRHFNQLNLKISENYHLADLQDHGHVNSVISSGRVDRRVHYHQTGRFPLLVNFEHPLALRAFVSQYRKLPAGLRQKAFKIEFSPTATDNERLRIFLKNGDQVLIRIGDLDRKFKYSLSIAKLMKRRGVINLEMGAYSYSFKGKRRK